MVEWLLTLPTVLPAPRAMSVRRAPPASEPTSWCMIGSMGAMCLQRTNVYLADDQIRALKHLAAEQGRSLAELVRQAVDRLLAEQGGPDPSWRERLDRVVRRADSRASQDAHPDQIEKDITAAWSGVRGTRSPEGDEAVRALVRDGLARPQRQGLPEDFWRMARPTDPQGAVRAAVLDEREEE